MPLPALRGEFFVPVPGEIRVGGWRVRTAVLDDVDEQEFEGLSPDHRLLPQGEGSTFTEVLDMDCVGERLRVRDGWRGTGFSRLGWRGRSRCGSS